ncbi:hypothetical protein BMS3Bbin06_00305 [bacterium BMS3Bbin06]|nr:hypothetical protein BMS3Abin08_00888 [bacterium BMS3Abin08]GBE33790.1 hypothetical protein BMS3Bbin06_00305 [bacterium BMS3Bbin06]HDO36218.1 hypothetical protein [Nitrospirota bacterium]
MHKKILEILSNKPEIVTGFPDWMLSGSRINYLRETEALAIAEIAGRDSIAATLKAVETGRIKAVIPTLVYSGTEFGDWNRPFEKIALLRELLKERGVDLFDPVILGSPKLWWMLCGRHTAQLSKTFGFYTPCLGCHLYFHAIRIPLSKMINSHIIISGERESHDGRVKLNQIGIALDAYISLLRKFDRELLLPLRYIRSGDVVQSIIGRPWTEGSQQIQCVMSKNYVGENDRVEYSEDAIKRFFNEFALPMAEEMIRKYIT